jgi:hypothetical protein
VETEKEWGGGGGVSRSGAASVPQKYPRKQQMQYHQYALHISREVFEYKELHTQCICTSSERRVDLQHSLTKCSERKQKSLNYLSDQETPLRDQNAGNRELQIPVTAIKKMSKVQKKKSIGRYGN